jgi:hypothetical protein
MRRSKAFIGPDEKAAVSKANLKNPRRASSTVMLQNEKVDCILTSARRRRGARVTVLVLEWEAKPEMMTLCRMKRQTFKD